MERELLKQRQRKGIEIAKLQGKYKGRKPISIDWTKFGQLYVEWKLKKITERNFMRKIGYFIAVCVSMRKRTASQRIWGILHPKKKTFRPSSIISFPCSMNRTLLTERKRLRIDRTNFGWKTYIIKIQPSWKRS